MINIYVSDIRNLNKERIYEICTQVLEQEETDRILRMTHEKSRMRSLLGRCLLCNGIKAYMKEEEGLPLLIGYGVNGKPYLKEYQDIFFNISHSGNLVACVIANQEIGIDIQEHNKADLKIADRFFSEKEKEQIYSCQTKEQQRELFFKLWCIKESYIKLTGKGLSQGLDTFSVDLDRKRILNNSKETVAHCHHMNIAEGYELAICGFHLIETGMSIIHEDYS